MISNRNPLDPQAPVDFFKLVKPSAVVKIQHQPKKFLIDPKSAIFSQSPSSTTKVDWAKLKKIFPFISKNKSMATTLSNLDRPSFLEILTFFKNSRMKSSLIVASCLFASKHLNVNDSRYFWQYGVSDLVHIPKDNVAYFGALVSNKPKPWYCLSPQSLCANVIADAQGRAPIRTLGDQVLDETRMQFLQSAMSTFETCLLTGALVSNTPIDIRQDCPILAKDEGLRTLMESRQGRAAICTHLSKPSENPFQTLNSRKVALAFQGATGVDVAGTIQQTLRIAHVSCLVLFIFLCMMYYPIVDTRYHLPQSGSPP
ncbi:MAG: hypothetical protein FJZ61_05550 [Chlamydiae bacterium]|nr:hypothetical protein [Chlamydiota bacterium]